MRATAWVAIPVLLAACAPSQGADRPVPVAASGVGTPTHASSPRPIEPASTPRSAGEGQANCIPTGSFGKRYAESVAFDPRLGAVVLFGGRSTDGPGQNASCDMWRWTGTAWAQLTPAHLPPGRAFGALFLDPASNQLILQGGGAPNADLPRTDTWAWDGTDWRQLFPAHRPPGFDLSARVASSSVLGPLDVTVVQSGGNTELQSWTWLDGDYRQIADSNRPPSRTLHGLAFDAQHGVYVMFGGDAGVGPPFTPLNETWTFDGRQWTERHPAHHPAAIGPVLAYFPERKVVVAWAMDGTWTWDGTDWTLVAAGARSPAWDFWGSLVHDPISHRLLLLGAKVVNEGQTMAWNGSAWERVA